MKLQFKASSWLLALVFVAALITIAWPKNVRAEPIYYLWEGFDCTLTCHEKATAQFTVLDYTPGTLMLVPVSGVGPNYLSAFRIGDDAGWQFISIGGFFPGRLGNSEDWFAMGTLPAESGIAETRFHMGAFAFILDTHADGSWLFAADGLNSHIARGLSHTFTRLDAPIDEPPILLLLAVGAAGIWLRARAG
jgi:hypothetical protein